MGNLTRKMGFILLKHLTGAIDPTTCLLLPSNLIILSGWNQLILEMKVNRERLS